MAKLFEHDESGTEERRKRSEMRMQRPFRASTPVTPIPRRASASSPGLAGVRSRHRRTYTELQEGDVTRLPTIPRSATWEDGVDKYEIDPALFLLPVVVPEFSPFLPSSPSIDELDTLPPTDESLCDGMPSARATNRVASVQPDHYNVQFPLEIAEPVQQKKAGLQFPLEIAEPVQQNGTSFQFPLEIPEGPERADISELATHPPPALFHPHSVLVPGDEPSYIDDVVAADTVMDDTLIVVSSLPTAVDRYTTQVEDVVDVALTVRARELLGRKGSMEDRPAFIHNPLDYVRWWLLCPGRLEFLFWLGGAVLLGMIMCVVLVVTGLGLGVMSFGHLAH